MIHRRTVLAALLTGLALATAASAAPMGRSYGQAADLAAGKPADAAYDGSSARGAVSEDVKGALNPGELVIPKVSTVAATGHDVLRPAVVPAPEKAEKEGFFSANSLKMAGGIGILGALVGFLAGGPAGMLIGAAVGAGIGFLMSKLLH
jgi:hypothetical protein